MKLNIVPTLKNYNFKNLPKDLIAGIIIMAVSIPISMGYAQIAGLPAVYGPYPLEGGVDNAARSASRKRADNRVQEFVWAFGSESEDQIEKQIKLQIEQLKKTKDVEEIMHGRWAHMDEFDQDEWLASA